MKKKIEHVNKIQNGNNQKEIHLSMKLCFKDYIERDTTLILF